MLVSILRNDDPLLGNQTKKAIHGTEEEHITFKNKYFILNSI